MIRRPSRVSVASGLLLLLAAGCSSFALPEDPCADANRPITFDALFKNSALGTYERCLQETRAEAVNALGNVTARLPHLR